MVASPMVSVVLCTYNQAEFLADAIESVLRQTYPNVELVVVDNGSTDSTSAVLDRYANQPAVLQLRFAENEAISRRLNQGIAASHGEYVSLLFGDDMYLPEKIAHQMALFEGRGRVIDVVHGPGIRWDIIDDRRWLDTDLPFSGDLLGVILREMHRRYFNPIAPLVRRNVFVRHPFHEDIFAEGEGIYMFIALDASFLYDARPLVVMREHERNIGKAYRANLDAVLAMLEKLEREPAFPVEYQPLLNPLRARLHRNLAWQLLRLTGRTADARGVLRETLHLSRRVALEPRSALALVLSLLPESFLFHANCLVTRLRRSPQSMAVRDGYR